MKQTDLDYLRGIIHVVSGPQATNMEWAGAIQVAVAEIESLRYRLWRAVGGDEHFECEHGVPIGERCRECRKAWEVRK